MDYIPRSDRFYAALDEIREILERDPEMVIWASGMIIYDISDIVENIAQTTRKKATYKKKISASLRLKVYRKDGYRCVICLTSEDLSVDHIIPESRGGVSTIDNLQTLCVHCNTVKGVK